MLVGGLIGRSTGEQKQHFHRTGLGVQCAIQTDLSFKSKDMLMEAPADVQIVAADRLNDGLVLKLQDGRCAFFSASLLVRFYDEAEQLEDDDPAW